MGVHVVLDIDPIGIDEAEWARAYDDTLALLEAWRPRLLGWAPRSIEGERVAMYARSIRRNEGDSKETAWCVVGDRESLQTAECQWMYRDLERYRQRASTDSAGQDIVVAAAHPNCKYTNGPANVFGDKTQGYPYHFAMLAAGMLVEERFPKHAMVYGDIDRGQAERVQKMAAPLLGRDLALPVRVDATRLIERLQTRYEGEALVAAFDRISLDDPLERSETVLRAFSGAEAAQHWLRELAGYKTPKQWGATRLIVAWLNAGRNLREACRLACVDPEGPRFAAEDFVAALASTWVAIPLPYRETLFGLRKPRGESHSVYSLLGSFLLDATGASGRHLRIHIEPATLTSILNKVFGTQGPVLAQQFFALSEKHERALRSSTEEVQAAFERAPEAADDSTESLVKLESFHSMRNTQRAVVHAAACSTSKVLAGLRAQTGWELLEQLTDPEKARLLLIRALRQRGPTLTEDAWDEILALRDVDNIAWLVALAVLPGDEIHFYQTRRAFFENAALRRYAIEVGNDPKVIAEIKELAANR